MKDYQQYCPIARGAEIFAERWTPLIVRNLFLGCATFSEIREGAPGIPKTVLSERLDGLARHGVVERRPNPAGRGSTYHLTPSGQELVEVCFALGDWGAKWLDVAPEQLDSHVVLWSMARLVDRNQLPTDRVVIRFDLTDLERKNRFWMVLERDHTEVCLKNPGFPEQLLVTTTSEWLAKWHMGWISMPQARAQGLITVEGPPGSPERSGPGDRAPSGTSAQSANRPRHPQPATARVCSTPPGSAEDSGVLARGSPAWTRPCCECRPAPSGLALA